MRRPSRCNRSACAVPDCRRRGTEPFDGLQLPPAVTGLTEHRQALLGAAVRGGRAASVHRQLGAACPGPPRFPAGRRAPPPKLASAGPAVASPADGSPKISCDEGLIPLRCGPDGVIDAAGGGGGHACGVVRRGCETAVPGRGPGGGGSVAGGKSRGQRAPGWCSPAAQEPGSGQGADDPVVIRELRLAFDLAALIAGITGERGDARQHEACHRVALFRRPRLWRPASR